jgi:F-type H+-transporting ATPase subunit gamma
MSETAVSLRRKISSASDLQGVVRSMKALAASNITQYEKSVAALSDYEGAVERGLGVCFRNHASKKTNVKGTVAIVFGSDQGLVGQFNELVCDDALKTFVTFSEKPQLWTVGERAHSRLLEAGFQAKGTFDVPSSVNSIAALVGQVLIKIDSKRTSEGEPNIYIFYNHPVSAAGYEPTHKKVWPLDRGWIETVTQKEWPTRCRPEMIGDETDTLRALVREYLFISLFTASAESLASENASRLSAMQRADKNIEEMLSDLQGSFHRLRQGTIDEELFDVVAGFEALSKEKE